MGRGERQHRPHPQQFEAVPGKNGDVFSCVDEDPDVASRNPREYFNRVSQKTADFEIQRVKHRNQTTWEEDEAEQNDKTNAEEAGEAHFVQEGEYIIKTNVPFASIHRFVEEELDSGSDESGED